jgi:phosphate uptake regulator
MSTKKSIETQLDDALFNLAIINNPKQAQQMKVYFKKVDLNDLHYVEQCAMIKIFQDSTHTSERKIASAFGISKTEINRMLAVSKLSGKIRLSALRNDADKWVLSHVSKMGDDSINKKYIIEGILDGSITKYKQVKGIR